MSTRVRDLEILGYLRASATRRTESETLRREIALNEELRNTAAAKAASLGADVANVRTQLYRGELQLEELRSQAQGKRAELSRLEAQYAAALARREALERQSTQTSQDVERVTQERASLVAVIEGEHHLNLSASFGRAGLAQGASLSPPGAPLNCHRADGGVADSDRHSTRGYDGVRCRRWERQLRCGSKSILAADFVVSMPKVKTHHWAGVTLSLKNMFGTIPGSVYGWPKNILHWKGIGRSILDINSTIPAHFVIADGIVAMEGNGPLQGTARDLGQIVMSDDPVAADFTCARLMGFDPYRISNLAQAPSFSAMGMRSALTSWERDCREPCGRFRFCPSSRI